ncbi:MAG: UDP-N-acetylmuramoyl-tripeptide--D-alanyl-D-alanine ligase [uncultured Solirubrobacteraceae bacterium]|uniref:UDP-N-acetylmuramoyl-tripeptide--D-alanyl-D-alanine ligase n=1 Tax=uncultured Solirubrobacteraceae bacterium TaxID=1162706 RepID=A0A6J4RN90_9ACTN|nr:MAG: UDP-N-acetylmuramoyl-tripeptide--D-alanyl-D-alanine ligase [uncultured Solirubrobacteraceae bacterium]
MRGWTPERVAEAAGADLLRGGPSEGPARAVIDSRSAGPRDLFVGLPGTRADGGSFAGQVLADGAWGVLVGPEWGEGALPGDGAILRAADPLLALHALARAWRRELGAAVIGVTGSVGKTSTKDLIAAMVGPHRSVAASRENFNTEIGLPLELLAAPPGTEVLVLELAMRGAGQIAELTAICEPDVGVITNIGPVHLQQLGSLEGIARAKGELLEGMRDGATAIVPHREPLLAPLLRDALEIVTFGGPDADVVWEESARVVRAGEDRYELELPFRSGPQLTNALAAVAAARAVGVSPGGRIDVALSPLRGQRVTVPGGVVVINDCYNASPPSMRAALDELAAEVPAGRRVAVLGDMLELGDQETALHREIGAYARDAGVELLVTVGPRAAAMLDEFDGESHAVADADEAAALAGELLADGDLVLVKASNGVELWRVAEALA